jgi:DNA-binding CsgD family transcriptional regulator
MKTSDRERCGLRELGEPIDPIGRTRRRIESLEAGCAHLMKTLDRISLGIILVHGVGPVLFANATARPILEEGDGLLVREGGLSASCQEGDAELRRLLGTATLARGNSRGGHRGGAMRIHRAPPKRPLSILVVPVADPMGRIFDSAGVAAVFVGDPDRAIEAPPEVLGRWYGLTPAESRLAQLLVQGMSLPMAARRLQISTHTARSQSKAIFEKTGARRQCEFVRLLLQGPAMLCP